MQRRITNEQIEILKKNIEKMRKSDEQFFFMVFKNKNGTDNMTGYSFNMIPEKMKYYWQKLLQTGQIQEKKRNEN